MDSNTSSGPSSVDSPSMGARRLDQVAEHAPVEPIPTLCANCKNPLKRCEDTHSARGSVQRFWKNCKSCRDKVTSQKRRAREAQAETRKRLKTLQTELTKREEVENPVSNEEVEINVEEERLDLPGSPAPYKHATERECSVCADSFPVQEFPSLSSCAHQAEVCQQCFLHWLDDQINKTNLEQIQCPMSGCTNLITHDDVKIYAPSDVFRRYDPSSPRVLPITDSI